jgi:hypothetical protein
MLYKKHNCFWENCLRNLDEKFSALHSMDTGNPTSFLVTPDSFPALKLGFAYHVVGSKRNSSKNHETRRCQIDI